MSISNIRLIFPAACETWAYSCVGNVNRGAVACLVACQKRAASTSTDNDVVNPNFINRNPRNLERLALARKSKGWRYQYPTREFYHRMVFEKTNRNISAKVEHSSGRVVLSASTKEAAVAQHLYSYSDVVAAKSVGQVLAQRCREAGITAMILHEEEHDEKSQKYAAFRQAVEDGGIDLQEPEEVQPAYEPGINYDDQEEMDDLQRRRDLVANVSPLTRMALEMRKNGKRGAPNRNTTIMEHAFKKTPVAASSD